MQLEYCSTESQFLTQYISVVGAKYKNDTRDDRALLH